MTSRKVMFEVFIKDEKKLELGEPEFKLSIGSTRRSKDLLMYYLSMLVDEPSVLPIAIDKMVKDHCAELEKKFGSKKTLPEKPTFFYLKSTVVKSGGKKSLLWKMKFSVDNFISIEEMKMSQERQEDFRKINIIDFELKSNIAPEFQDATESTIDRLIRFRTMEKQQLGQFEWYINSYGMGIIDLFHDDVNHRNIVISSDPHSKTQFRIAEVNDSYKDDVVDEARYTPYTHSINVKGIPANEVAQQYMKNDVRLFQFYIKGKGRKVFIGDPIVKHNISYNPADKSGSKKYIVTGITYNEILHSLEIRYADMNEDGSPKPLQFSLAISTLFDTFNFDGDEYKLFDLPYDSIDKLNEFIDSIESSNKAIVKSVKGTNELEMFIRNMKENLSRVEQFKEENLLSVHDVNRINKYIIRGFKKQ